MTNKHFIDLLRISIHVLDMMLYVWVSHVIAFVWFAWFNVIIFVRSVASEASGAIMAHQMAVKNVPFGEKW